MDLSHRFTVPTAVEETWAHFQDIAAVAECFPGAQVTSAEGDSFTVPASLGETWRTFEDIESVAGCFPGATVTEVDGNDFKGTCKVKLGPIAMVYSGTGTFVEKDESAGRFVIDAKGKDKRGNGTAGALVTASLTDAGDGVTRVDVNTDLAITGKPAQFGRGVIEDISNKLLQQFVTCLQDRVGKPEGDDELGRARLRSRGGRRRWRIVGPAVRWESQGDEQPGHEDGARDESCDDSDATGECAQGGA